MFDEEEVKFSLKVMINKEKTKVLFAEADNHFAYILLSFLTLPLGRIVKLLEKHYGDEAPSIGSLTTLYHSLADLDSAHFWTEGAKMTMLDPTNSCEAEYEKLKLDICDYQPGEYFVCSVDTSHNRIRSVSLYYDKGMIHCPDCRTSGSQGWMNKQVGKKGSETAASKGVFTTHTTSFVISDGSYIEGPRIYQVKDDLTVTPFSIASALSSMNELKIPISDVEEVQLQIGLKEALGILKASLISTSALSDGLMNPLSIKQPKPEL